MESDTSRRMGTCILLLATGMDMHGAMAEDLLVSLLTRAGGIVKVADQGSRCPSRVASPKSDRGPWDTASAFIAFIRLMCG